MHTFISTKDNSILPYEIVIDAIRAKVMIKFAELSVLVPKKQPFN